MQSAAPDSTDTELRRILGAFLFSGDAVDQRAGTLSGGEKTRLAMATLVVSGANVLLLDEPTNNLDPASREQVLNALRTYTGAIVLVTHDEGAVRALNPDKVILLPDGTEDSLERGPRRPRGTGLAVTCGPPDRTAASCRTPAAWSPFGRPFGTPPGPTRNDPVSHVAGAGGVSDHVSTGSWL